MVKAKLKPLVTTGFTTGKPKKAKGKEKSWKK
jgi:hypothetical protein